MHRIHQIFLRSGRFLTNSFPRFDAKCLSTIEVFPQTQVLIDKRIEIKVNGLNSFQKVTLRTELWSQPGTKTSYVFESYGHFISDIHGSLNLTKNASFGGTYNGVDGMGLFWSMMQVPGQRKGGRFIPSDVTRPLEFKVSLYDGHVTSESKAKSVEEALGNLPTPLATTTILRTYLSDNVERHEISVGRIRGTLFVPKGNRKFPGVIDLFGVAGGLYEHRAAILASRGFVTFALAVYAYKDLPDDFNYLNLEYFLEAVEWLARHNKVHPNGIGFIGVSSSGTLALMSAAETPLISAVVAISSPDKVSLPVKYKGENYGPPRDLSGKFFKVIDGDTLIAHDSVEGPHDRSSEIPVEKISGAIMAVCGGADMCVDATKRAHLMNERLSLNKRPLLTCLIYPGAGHLIEVPYMPMCSLSYVKFFKHYFLWGGNMVDHSSAQEHSWNAIREFLLQNINGSSSNL